MGCASLQAAEAPRRGAEAGKYGVGQSYFIGGSWFQYLGKNTDGADRWLYPHLDGVGEIFVETKVAQPGRAGRTYWQGDLETRFQPETGVFSNLWGPAEALNEALGAETAERRRASARVLALYLEIRGAPLPYYVREDWPTAQKYLTADDRAWVKAAAAEHAAALQGIAKAGTSVPGLETPLSLKQGPREYYRRMIEDGYLDVCIVGGNMYDNERCTFNSWAFVEELRKKLEVLRLKDYPCRGSADRSVAMKAVRLMGRDVTLRIRHTGGSSQYFRIVRGVTNFVEGLAHADVFIYHGHSNVLSGTYYVSEAVLEYARFQIGLENQKDLAAKCHGLKQKPYQLLAFQSCTSYDKYARPIRWYYEKNLADAPGRAGFMGNAAYCYFVDFAPRYSVLLDLLLKEKGPREIAGRLDAIRPHPQTPNMIFRGILQPRFTFIVPKGVTIADMAEARADGWNAVTGKGSDGVTYDSTENFPQDSFGEAVQVARVGDDLYALYADGTVMVAGPATDGAPKASPLTAATNARFVYLARMQDERKQPLLALVGKDGRLYVKPANAAQAAAAPIQPPQGTRFVAVGEDAEGDLVAQDDKGAWHAWDLKARAFAPLEKAPALKGATPSLLGHGVKGELWAPELTAKR
ncbi:MAG: hypothetical protein KIS92_02795 [Planctomycetota bacterium]|nr:hypothetical protein [Planctomycetota bacterium]